MSNSMACNSTSNVIVPSPSSSATTTRSVGFRSLFSSCRNCFDCCRSVMTSSPNTHPSKQIEPENEDTNAFEQIERKNGHSNAFEGAIPSAACSNRPTMPQRKLPYDVFINHRGPDVKHTLAGSLYKTLTGKGLRVFLDKEEIELGGFLPLKIEEAIQCVSLYIAIFFQNYAESPWCLAELAFMLKMATEIVPVFYHVEIDVVRYAKGVYAEAFSRHEEKGRYASKLLGEWKNALQNVSYNFGDIVRNEDDEGRLLKNIVNRVLKEM